MISLTLLFVHRSQTTRQAAQGGQRNKGKERYVKENCTN